MIVTYLMWGGLESGATHLCIMLACYYNTIFRGGTKDNMIDKSFLYTTRAL